MNKKEILQNHLRGCVTFSTNCVHGSATDVLDAMEEYAELYHENKVKTLGLFNSSVLKAIEEMKLGGTQQYALGNDDAVRKVLSLLNDC